VGSTLLHHPPTLSLKLSMWAEGEVRQRGAQIKRAVFALRSLVSASRPYFRPVPEGELLILQALARGECFGSDLGPSLSHRLAALSSYQALEALSKVWRGGYRARRTRCGALGGVWTLGGFGSRPLEGEFFPWSGVIAIV
jgi:hypothetical protein